jgi:hypothetical protein
MTDPRPGAEHHHVPIVPRATWIVRCADCGFAYDSAAPNPKAAVEEVAAQHQAGHNLEAEAVNYDNHPRHMEWNRRNPGRR